MEKPQEFPFRKRGRRGFDTEDVINYISSEQARCNEHVARLQELEDENRNLRSQAQSLESENRILKARLREVEERGHGRPAESSRPVGTAIVPPAWSGQATPPTADTAVFERRIAELEDELSKAKAQQASPPGLYVFPDRNARAPAAPAAPAVPDRAYAEKQERIAELEDELQLVRAEYGKLHAENDELAEKLEAAAAAAERADREKSEALRAIAATPPPKQDCTEELRAFLSSTFSASDVYVENNLQTAQTIYNTAQAGAKAVDETAGQLATKLEGAIQTFSESAAAAKAQVEAFRTEMQALQTLTDKSLARSRFTPLLEESRRLREQIESEAFQVKPAPVQSPTEAEAAALPFADELPRDYRDFLDD
ncbi:MAG: hypothetical protein LBR73_03895 [Oscillospiraceae bacterium]|nr:hypothetical protein [Oscillospiraceae bacterium]